MRLRKAREDRRASAVGRARTDEGVVSSVVSSAAENCFFLDTVKRKSHISPAMIFL